MLPWAQRNHYRIFGRDARLRMATQSNFSASMLLLICALVLFTTKAECASVFDKCNSCKVVAVRGQYEGYLKTLMLAVARDDH
jgi:hypothetical protein